MKLIDFFEKLEHNRNKYLPLRLDLANQRQAFAGLLPVRVKRRSYVHFNNLIQGVRRLSRLFACGSYCTIMQPDITKYREYVDRFDINEDQKIALIHTIWNTMGSFVDRAFGDDPVQHCLQSENAKDSGHASRVLESKDNADNKEPICRNDP